MSDIEKAKGPGEYLASVDFRDGHGEVRVREMRSRWIIARVDLIGPSRVSHGGPEQIQLGPPFLNLSQSDLYTAIFAHQVSAHLAQKTIYLNLNALDLLQTPQIPPSNQCAT